MERIGILGYGSLISFQSASRTLKRNLTHADLHEAILYDYKRTWTYWAYVHSIYLDKIIKGVFLNIENNPYSKLNGVVFEVSSQELEYLKSREKNYDCVDVTKNIKLIKTQSSFDIIYAFVGNESNLINLTEQDLFVFKKYISIVEEGLKTFDEEFSNLFRETTNNIQVPLIEGDYNFIDNEQQKSR